MNIPRSVAGGRNSTVQMSTAEVHTTSYTSPMIWSRRALNIIGPPLSYLALHHINWLGGVSPSTHPFCMRHFVVKDGLLRVGIQCADMQISYMFPFRRTGRYVRPALSPGHISGQCNCT